MAPILVVVGLLVLGAVIVAWATRRQASRPDVKRRGQTKPRNDPMTLARGKLSSPHRTGSVFLPQPEAFAEAPVSTSQVIAVSPEIAQPAPFPSLILTPSQTSDPFAHAPALSDLASAPMKMRR